MPLTIWTATLAANSDCSDERDGFLVRKAFATIVALAFPHQSIEPGVKKTFDPTENDAYLSQIREQQKQIPICTLDDFTRGRRCDLWLTNALR